MLRRALMAAAFALAATPAFAVTETQTVPVDKVFPFIGNYYGLKPADRAHFHLEYRLMPLGTPLSEVKLAINGAPVSIGNGGVVSPLPSDAQVKAKAQITITQPKGAKFGMSMMIAPNAAGSTVDAAILNASVTEAHNGAKSMAGLISFVVPDLDRVVAYGVTSGQVIMANGQARALPFAPATTGPKGGTRPAHVTYVPADWPGARTVTFNAAPGMLSIEPKS